ncbi:hypothetical protein K443DRAFT_94807 [Laccaria amethystina LaAM-08-1]|uniref:Uncharacterized protein n=1 Tax=Laccaria amethystina LaAM-08-1 TaxID=1095629 RepID=A0A0C9WVN9_9AGAR|nr:hypothetical protein K443DRAFT_94807 [Laccaria amethystina LaAM-08-1]
MLSERDNQLHHVPDVNYSGQIYSGGNRFLGRPITFLFSKLLAFIIFCNILSSFLDDFSLVVNLWRRSVRNRSLKVYCFSRQSLNGAATSAATISISMFFFGFRALR